MNAVYPSFRLALAEGTVDLSAAPVLTLYALDQTAVYDPLESDPSSLAGSVVGVPDTLTAGALTVSAERVELEVGSAPVTIASTGPNTVTAFVVTVDDGTERLAAWIDTRADGGPVSFVSSGDVHVAFPQGWLLRL